MLALHVWKFLPWLHRPRILRLSSRSLFHDVRSLLTRRWKLDFSTNFRSDFQFSLSYGGKSLCGLLPSAVWRVVFRLKKENQNPTVGFFSSPWEIEGLFPIARRVGNFSRKLHTSHGTRNTCFSLFLCRFSQHVYWHDVMAPWVYELFRRI
jgi:hypothetical protein